MKYSKRDQVVGLILLVALILFGTWFIKTEFFKSTPNPIIVSKPINKPKVIKLKTVTPVMPISYGIGDSQTYQTSVVKLNSVTTNPGSAMDVGYGYEYFVANLTITNNGTLPIQEGYNGQVSQLSYIYLNNNTYVYPILTPVDGCFNTNIAYIAPNQTVTGCITFEIPTNVLVDTYFYGGLKWYL